MKRFLRIPGDLVIGPLVGLVDCVRASRADLLAFLCSAHSRGLIDDAGPTRGKAVAFSEIKFHSELQRGPPTMLVISRV
jgi:hypothetical protein